MSLTTCTSGRWEQETVGLETECAGGGTVATDRCRQGCPVGHGGSFCMCDVVLASSQLEEDLTQADDDAALFGVSVALHLYHLVVVGDERVLASSPTMSLTPALVVVVSSHPSFRLAGIPDGRWPRRHPAATTGLLRRTRPPRDPRGPSACSSTFSAHRGGSGGWPWPESRPSCPSAISSSRSAPRSGCRGATPKEPAVARWTHRQRGHRVRAAQRVPDQVGDEPRQLRRRAVRPQRPGDRYPAPDGHRPAARRWPGGRRRVRDPEQSVHDIASRIVDQGRITDSHRAYLAVQIR